MKTNVTLSALQNIVGQTFTGKVTKKLTKKTDGDAVKTVGALVRIDCGTELGKQTGLVHISKFPHPQIDGREAMFANLKEGDEMTVRVLEVAEDTAKGGFKIGLSARDAARESDLRALEGSVITVEAKNFLTKKGQRGDYRVGVFAALTAFDDGLVHVSELEGGPKRLDTLKKGDKLEVVIKSITADGDSFRIALSEVEAKAAKVAVKTAAEQAQRAERAAQVLPTIAVDAVLMARNLKTGRSDGLELLLDDCVPAFLPTSDFNCPPASVKNTQQLKVKVVSVDAEAGTVLVTRMGL